MSCTDFIADQLTIIRNGIMAKKKNVIIRRSKFIEGIVDIIKKEGFIDDYKVIDDNKQGKIKVYLKWLDDESSVMELGGSVNTLSNCPNCMSYWYTRLSFSLII